MSNTSTELHTRPRHRHRSTLSSKPAWRKARTIPNSIEMKYREPASRQQCQSSAKPETQRSYPRTSQNGKRTEPGQGKAWQVPGHLPCTLGTRNRSRGLGALRANGVGLLAERLAWTTFNKLKPRRSQTAFLKQGQRGPCSLRWRRSRSLD
ncbi:hypothetical protein BKA80DRAFT_5071 [Phyllosticta citrichinensis]